MSLVEVKPLTVVGVDISMTSTGVATIRVGRSKPLSVQTFKSAGKRLASWFSRRNRLYDLANRVVDAVNAEKPDLVVIEGPSYGSNLAGKHDISGLWWIISGPLMADYPVLIVAPKARAKYATGDGNAGKDVVRAHVTETYTDLLDGLRFRNDDECDATALAAMGARIEGQPIEDLHGKVLTGAKLAAMDKVTWADPPDEAA